MELAFSGEPLLGPRQAAFLDGITERLRYGPPLSVPDEKAMLMMFALLKL